MRRDVFQAIADPVRRDIIDLLSKETLTVNEVAQHFDISRPAKEGREQIYAIQSKSLVPAFVWMEPYQKIWEDKLDSFENYLNRLKNQTKKNE